MFRFPWRLSTTPLDAEDEDDLVLVDEARLPLHVLADDAELHVENGMLVIDSAEDSREIRVDELSLVALHGGSRVSVPCLHMLGRQNVPLVLHSRSGYYIGQTIDLSINQSAVRRAQYTTTAEPRRVLLFARSLVCAKIASAARLARRRLGSRNDTTRALLRAAKKAGRASSTKTLRGIEGAAAAAWYSAWPGLIGDAGSEFTFDGRSRRPPRDAVNALLSYLYAVVVGNAAAAAAAAGLDPNAGLLHTEKPGRPALALDLAEPFRTAVVDAAVLSIIRRHEISLDLFETQPNGAVRLSDDGRRRALELLERRLSTSFVYDGSELTWRAAITRLAELLAKALQAGTDELVVPQPRR